MPFSSWRDERWGGLYVKAYKLSRFLIRQKRGVIGGLPGSGKTLVVLLAAAEYVRDRPVVFAVPLRELRDDIYSRRFSTEPLSMYRDRAVRVRAHDEVCQPLAERIKNGAGYFAALAQHLRGVKAGTEPCEWKTEIKKGLDALRNNKLVITTHTIALVLQLYARAARLRNVLFIYDEGDDFILNVNQPLLVGELKVLEDLDPPRFKRMIKLMSAHVPRRMWNEKTGLWVRGDILLYALKNSFFITATWPRSLTEVLRKYFNIQIETYRLRSPRANDIIILNQDELHIAAQQVWTRKLAPQLLQIAESAVERVGAVAFIARSKKNNKWITSLLEAAGYVVWSDVREDNKYSYSDADAVVVTTLGRGYRGINFFSRRTGADFPVIVAFYQARANEVRHPLLLRLLEDDPLDDRNELSLLEHDLLHAKNVQALFRVNRFRNRRHVVILLDARWWGAIHNYAYTWYTSCQVLKTRTDDVASVAVPLIKSIDCFVGSW